MKDTFYSRYDFMMDGSVIDEETGQTYPDPLSMDYTNLQVNRTPWRDEMNDDKISAFWHEAHKVYGNTKYDDMVLNLNGVMHKNLLKRGDVVYFPAEEDITSSFELGRDNKR